MKKKTPLDWFKEEVERGFNTKFQATPKPDFLKQGWINPDYILIIATCFLSALYAVRQQAKVQGLKIGVTAYDRIGRQCEDILRDEIEEM